MGLVDWLIAPRLQRLMAALLLHPESSYSVRDLARITGVGNSGTQTAITNMVSAGVVVDQRVGNQRRLKANPAYPLYAELRSICIKSFGVTDRLRVALVPFGTEIQRAFVFGSMATGQDKADSDIDLMLIGQVDNYIGLTNAMHEVGDELGRPVHYHLYAPDEWQRLLAADPLIKEIAEGAKIEVLIDGV